MIDRPRCSWILLVALLAVPLAASAQDEEAPAQEEGFVEALDVRVVNVEVFVTDKKGNPVEGLTTDDFEISEDGRPVAITNFYAVEGRQRVEPDPSGQQERDAGGVAPLSPSGSLQRLHLIVYIDNFNIRPFNRNRVFRRLSTFLSENVTDRDRVMLVSYDRTLNLRQPFTNDTSLINSALFDLERVSGHGVHADSERRRLLQTIEDADNVSEAMLQLRPYAESVYNDLSFTIDALEEMIDSLAGLEGRKAILYVSDGVPMKAAEELFHMVQQKFQYSPVMTQMMDFDASRDYRTLANKASTNGVVFYAIDAAGLRTLSSVSVETGGTGLPGMSSAIDSIHIQNVQAPLRFMADATGGYAVVNTNDIGDDLVQIANDFQNYYSLGYAPAHAGDGRLHRIEVKLKDGQKGLRVRHRGSYRDKSTAAHMVDGTLAALRYGFAENPLGVLLRIGQASQREDELFLVPIRVDIPIGEIVLAQRADHYFGRTRLYVGAIDDREGISDVSDLELPIQIPADQYDDAIGKYYAYETTLLMRGGQHRVAVGVRDELGAAASYVTETFFVEER